MKEKIIQLENKEFNDRGDEHYIQLVNQIEVISANAKRQAVYSVNSALVEMNWNIGRHIIEYEQSGNMRATYGAKLIPRLSHDLTLHLGRGYSKSNLANMRLFYLNFPIFQTVFGKLTWSHWIELIGIENKLERDFYYAESINQQWSVRELRAHRNRGLFYQIAASKNQDELLQLSQTGIVPEKPKDIIKNTYYLDFLDLPEPVKCEDDLEKSLLRHMEQFLLELGKGFAFVGRQYRLTIDNDDYYADLVFYHVILKCYVIIDLKRGKVKHQDIGQMNMYLGYFAMDKNTQDDNPPIGIILAADKNDVMVRYATYGMAANLFVAKYQLYLPEIEELKQLVHRELKKVGE